MLEVVHRTTPVDTPVVVHAELVLAGIECLASLPALEVLIVRHVNVSVPRTTDRTDNADGVDSRNRIGHLLQVNLYQIEACCYAVDIRTAIGSQCATGSIARGFLPVTIPIVLVGLELEFAVQPDDGFILSETIAIERMRLTPAAFVTNLVDELVEANGCISPCLIKHIEGEVIEQSIGVGRDNQVVAFVVVIELTLFLGSCQTAAPVAAKTALGRHLELDVAAILSSGDAHLEGRILVRVAAVVGQLVGRVGVVPAIDGTSEVVGCLDVGSLRNGRDMEHVGENLYRRTAIGEPRADRSLNGTLNRTAAKRFGDITMQVCCRHHTVSSDVVSSIATQCDDVGSKLVAGIC